MIFLLAAPENRIVEAVVLLASIAALVLIALVVLLTLGYLLGQRHRLPVTTPSSVPAAPLTQAVAVNDPMHHPQLVAVLTAAAVAALGQPVRVTDIQPAHSEPVGPLNPSA